MTYAKKMKAIEDFKSTLLSDLNLLLDRAYIDLDWANAMYGEQEQAYASSKVQTIQSIIRMIKQY
jgi:hypothetical protein